MARAIAFAIDSYSFWDKKTLGEGSFSAKLENPLLAGFSPLNPLNWGWFSPLNPLNTEMHLIV